MQIGKILFPVTTLGPGERVGIWLLGCNRNCKGCSNPELQFFDSSKDVSVEEIFDFMGRLDYEGVTISGGEPFLQAKELKKLIALLRGAGTEDILVYSGYTKRELEDMHSPDVDYILSHIAVLIDGPFVAELADDVPLRGSSNQKVWLFDDRFERQYISCLNEKKTVDIFRFGNETHFIGIPLKNFRRIYAEYAKLR